MRLIKALLFGSLFIGGLSSILLLTACGQKGPLIIPQASQTDAADNLKQTDAKARTEKSA